MDERGSNPEPSTANIFEVTRRTVVDKSKGIGELGIVGAGAAMADAVYSAIQAKDDEAFDKAYADLTDACNSCHQALNHGVVEIKVPSRTSASDLNTDRVSRN